MMAASADFTSYTVLSDKSKMDRERECLKKDLWAKAMRDSNVSYAPKGSKAYEKVLGEYKRLYALADPVSVFWREACKRVTGEEFVRREDPRYKDVRSVFDGMRQAAADLRDPFAV